MTFVSEFSIRPVLVAAAFVLLSVVGCGNSTGTSSPDLAPASQCGHPGDTGNSLGVGRYCEKFSDCQNNGQATYCVRIVDPSRFFCSFPCDADGGANVCGEDATCECNTMGCGCAPNVCVAHDGGTD